MRTHCLALVVLIASIACKSSDSPIDQSARIDPWKRDALHFAGGSFKGRHVYCDVAENFVPSSYPHRDGAQLHVTDFDIDRRVVSCDEYAHCVRAGHCERPLK